MEIRDAIFDGDTASTWTATIDGYGKVDIRQEKKTNDKFHSIAEVSASEKFILAIAAHIEMVRGYAS